MEKETLRLENTYFWENFSRKHSFLKFSELLRINELVIDLSEINKVDPGGLFWINFLLLYRSYNQLISKILLPNIPIFSPSPKDEKLIKRVAYLKYLGFNQIIKQLSIDADNVAVFNLSEIDKYSPTNEFKKIYKNQRIFDSSSFNTVYFEEIKPDLVKYLYSLLYPENEKIIFDEGYDLILGFCRVIYEIMENIICHGGKVKNLGKGMVSLVPPTDFDTKFSMYFSDCGPGLVQGLNHEISEYSNLESIAKMKRDLGSFKEKTINYYKRLISYVFLYRKINPSDTYFGYFNIIPFFIYYKAIFKLRTDCLYCEIDFSKIDYYKFIDSSSKIEIDFIENLISEIVLTTNIPGTHIKNEFILPLRGNQ